MKYLLIIFIFSFILPQLEAKLIADDFDNPVFVTNYPDDNKKLLVIEQKGIIKIVKNSIFIN